MHKAQLYTEGGATPLQGRSSDLGDLLGSSVGTHPASCRHPPNTSHYLKVTSGTLETRKLVELKGIFLRCRGIPYGGGDRSENNLVFSLGQVPGVCMELGWFET